MQSGVEIPIHYPFHQPEVEGNQITIKNGEGKLWNFIIQPQEMDVTLVGGKGHEFEVNGVNYPPKTSKKQDVARWAGSWRVEVKQNKAQKETQFLNVLVPTEDSQENPPDIERIPGSVRVENWFVTYNEDGFHVVDSRLRGNDNFDAVMPAKAGIRIDHKK